MLTVTTKIEGSRREGKTTKLIELYKADTSDSKIFLAAVGRGVIDKPYSNSIIKELKAKGVDNVVMLESDVTGLRTTSFELPEGITSLSVYLDDADILSPWPTDIVMSDAEGIVIAALKLSPDIDLTCAYSVCAIYNSRMQGPFERQPFTVCAGDGLYGYAPHHTGYMQYVPNNDPR